MFSLKNKVFPEIWRALEYITRIVYFVCAFMAPRNISIFSVSCRNQQQQQRIDARLFNLFIYSKHSLSWWRSTSTQTVVIKSNWQSDYIIQTEFFLRSTARLNWIVWLKHLTPVLGPPSVIALTKARASGVAERMLSTLPSRKRRIDALS